MRVELSKRWLIMASREMRMKDNKISRSGVLGWGHMTDHMTMILYKSHNYDITIFVAAYKSMQKLL